MQPSPAWKSDYTFVPLEEPEAPSEVPEVHFEEPEAPVEEPAVSADISAAWSPAIATLVERFNEPPSAGFDQAPAIQRPAPSPRFAAPRQDLTVPERAQTRMPVALPAGARLGASIVEKLRMSAGTLIPGLVGLAVVPLSFLFFLWWQDAAPQNDGPMQELTITSASASGMAEPAQEARAPGLVLAAPERLEADAGAAVPFPIAIETAESLPERSIVAVNALPQGASFSQGRPYGDTGWSLRPDEVAGLQLQLPARSGSADLRVELVGGDGTVLAQTTTEVSITPPPVASVDPADQAAPIESAQVEPMTGAAADETASAEGVPAAETAPATAALKGPVAEAEPAPQQNSAQAPAREPEVKVNTVKTVAVAPPRETKPYDGAMALGSPAEEAQASDEWMETKTAVDMHAKAQQSSDTVKVAASGLKLRVTGRDKNWIQVTDPKSGTTGWIYNRFLKETEAPE